MKIAIIPANGIGDAVLFLPIFFLCKKLCHNTSIFSNHFESFGPWAQNICYQKKIETPFIENELKNFDIIILQHDNSENSKKISKLGNLIYTFYGEYNIQKHGALKEKDYVCDKQKSMLWNVLQAQKLWFGEQSDFIDFAVPEGLIHQKHTNKIAIHPSSTSPDKNWPEAKYKQLALSLQKKGYQTIFITENNKNKFDSIGDLLSFLYEIKLFIGNDSGPGHLASALKIPTITLGSSKKHLSFWRPSFFENQIVHPPFKLDYFSFVQKNWKPFITIRMLLKLIKKYIN